MPPFFIETAILLLLTYVVGFFLGYFLRWGINAAGPAAAAEQGHSSEASNTVQRTTGGDSAAPVLAAAGAAAIASAAVLSARPAVEQSAEPQDHEAKEAGPRPESSSIASQILSINADQPQEEKQKDTRERMLWPIPVSSEGAAMVVSEVVLSRAVLIGGFAHAAQDLTRIQHIDTATAAVLQRGGITRYEQIAAWNEGDVERIDRALGGMLRIQSENWIAQASLLATGGSPRDRVDAQSSMDLQRDGHLISGLGDDLSAIDGITPEIERFLKTRGIRFYAQIAALESAHVTDLNRLLGNMGRIERENWIGQAHLLSGGVVQPVSSSDRLISGLGDNLTAIDGITPEIERFLKTQGIRFYAQIAALESAHVTGLNGLLGNMGRIERENWIGQAHLLSGGVVQPVSSSDRLISGLGDDLTAIDGITPEIERFLKTRGIRFYAQIAALESAHVTGLNHLLGNMGRIERENWIGQAHLLSGGVVQPVSSGDRLISGLGDNLSAIDGITPEIERFLKTQGIRFYAQIAALEDKNLARLNRLLGVSGRIEREDWAGQAYAAIGNGAIVTSHKASGVVQDDLRRIRGISEHVETKLNRFGF